MQFTAITTGYISRRHDLVMPRGFVLNVTDGVPEGRGGFPNEYGQPAVQAGTVSMARRTFEASPTGMTTVQVEPWTDVWGDPHPLALWNDALTVEMAENGRMLYQDFPDDPWDDES